MVLLQNTAQSTTVRLFCKDIWKHSSSLKLVLDSLQDAKLTLMQRSAICFKTWPMRWCLVLKSVRGDEGSDFKGRRFAELEKTFHILQTRPSLRHPQGNWQGGWMNRTLIEVLKAFTMKAQPNNWDSSVSYSPRISSCFTIQEGRCPQDLPTKQGSDNRPWARVRAACGGR